MLSLCRDVSTKDTYHRLSPIRLVIRGHGNWSDQPDRQVMLVLLCQSKTEEMKIGPAYIYTTDYYSNLNTDKHCITACMYIYIHINTHLYNTSTNNMCIYRLYEYTHGTPHKSLASLQSPSEACIWILISCWECVRQDKVSNISLHLAAHLQDIQTNLSWLPTTKPCFLECQHIYPTPLKARSVPAWYGRQPRRKDHPSNKGVGPLSRGLPFQGYMKHDAHDVDVAILHECPVCLLKKTWDIWGHGKMANHVYSNRWSKLDAGSKKILWTCWAYIMYEQVYIYSTHSTNNCCKWFIQYTYYMEYKIYTVYRLYRA